MSRKFVTEEQLSEVVDLIVEQEKFTVDNVNSNFKTVKEWMESHSGGGDAEALSEEEATELVNGIGGARTEADYVINPPHL
jgi:hypothetical protein